MGVFSLANEQEVLFRSGHSFQVLDVTEQSGKVLIIMEEI